MKRIIVDHLRRWWWVWCAIVIGQFLLSQFIGSPTQPDDPDVFFFQLAFFLGAFQLSTDLGSGLARALLILPVSRQRIARAWWYVSVAFPSIAMFLVSFVATGMFASLYQLHVELIVTRSFIVFLWLGSIFFLLSLMSKGNHGRLWDKGVKVFAGVCWGLAFGGAFLIFKDLSFAHPGKLEIFMIAGASMTVSGWFRAERLVLQQGEFRSGIDVSNQRSKPVKVQKGFGGLPFLAQHIFVRVAYMILGMFAIMWLMPIIDGHPTNLSFQQWVKRSTFGGGIPFVIIFITQLTPVIQHLRQLRAMPIPTTTLAATLTLLVIAPILILSGILASIAAAMQIAAGSLLVIKGACLLASVTTLCVPIYVWRGPSQTTLLVIMLLTLATFLSAELMLDWNTPIWLALALSSLCIVACFVATKMLLARSSRAYRPVPVNTNAFSNYR